MAGAQSTATLEAQLRKATSKSEKMTLSYELAEKYLSRQPQKASEYAHRASMLASELGEKRVEADAIFLNAEALLKRRQYRESAAKFNQAWNTARNYGLRDVALNSMTKLEEIAVKENDLREALKWSREKVDYLTENSGRSSSSGDIVRRLQSEIATLEQEKARLLVQLSQMTNPGTDLERMRNENEALLKEFQEKTKVELTRKDSAIIQIRQQNQNLDSLARQKDKLVSLLTKEQMADSMIRAQQEVSLQEEKRLRAEAELAQKQSENLRNVLALLAGFVFVLALLFYARFVAKKRMANNLTAKNKIIEEEQKKIDGLLENILPRAIAAELKENNKVAAQKYDQATVMFVDFIGFTGVSEKLGPEELVQELDYCFSNFDRIIGKYNIEKIKTVGDAYICASGLSDKNASPSDIVKAALEIQDFLQHTKAARLDQGLPFFEARAGVHTGPVVAGVVGKKKFAYDIWGDTVNVAARMEEACEPGRVNVSEAAYWLSKYDFEWQHRGKLAAKNKGMMDMYYVMNIKQY
jgi:class 3 adenylate cyclase